MSQEWSVSDIQYMKLALEAAQKQLGRTGTNPAVGCVIVAYNKIVGKGATADGGRPHAEAMAVAQAKSATQGATVYVTLEPCAHHSERGLSCCQVLIEAGVGRLVCCVRDPDPRTEGKGFERLREAGVQVEVGLLADEGNVQIADFASRFDF